MLARLLLALVEGREPLSPALGRLGRDVVQGAEGPRAGILAPVTQSLVQPQRDLGQWVGGHCRARRLSKAIRMIY